MWTQISLRSLGVIEAASLDLGPGFTVVTGETGAGKTMVVTALDLLRGERADAGLVRRGDPNARVEARLDVPAGHATAAEVDQIGGELDDGELILARTVSAEGRSRCQTGGAAVPVGVLRRVTEPLVAVHGQSDQHRLLRPAAQREALDRHAGPELDALLADYRPGYRRLAKLTQELRELADRRAERLREAGVLRFGLDEIAAVAPDSGEDEALRAEEDRLAHADGLRLAGRQAHDLLSGADAEGGDATSLLGEARKLLDAVRGHDTELDSLAERVADLSYQVADVGGELASYSASVDADPARLAVVQERRAELIGLTRKYGPTLADVATWAEQAATRLIDLEGTDERIEELEQEQTTLQETVLDLAGQISTVRHRVAEELGRQVTAELGDLAMPHAVLTVDVRTPEPSVEVLGPDGLDEVELLLAANPGSAPRPLNKGASGGELSRVMLGLEVVLADTAAVPLFVFDEVDAGVGGQAAVEVGRRLARLAAGTQVIAVTHLPQVAAFADRHFHVVKSDDGRVTTSDVQRLDGAERVEELSRMLAGLEGSATARAHAEELLQLAAAGRV